MGFLGDLKKLFFAQKSVAKSAANKAKEQGEEWIDEAKEHGEELYEKARDKGGEFYENAKSKSEELYDQAKQKGSEWKIRQKISWMISWIRSMRRMKQPRKPQSLLFPQLLVNLSQEISLSLRS